MCKKGDGKSIRTSLGRWISWEKNNSGTGTDEKL